ncbi:hypothetical protein HanHA300_Chr12g0447501 [Helianthus annuus]|nr:hypothetical protein HanHA300_Chr12g0447501 [Helianthus annuus]KAJ0505662.1 hypothetical protein HanHA89_Chr12g0473021 [Helianthus annuus]KAJ0675330.1 hypothetical protein HanLR1_Chr12g0449951 [Helianthus annuus]
MRYMDWKVAFDLCIKTRSICNRFDESINLSLFILFVSINLTYLIWMIFFNIMLMCGEESIEEFIFIISRNLTISDQKN